MTDSPSPNSPTEPRRTAAISSGKYSSGSVFRLVREIRGSAYSVGDEFILSEEQDCFNPSVLRLGGVGENYFADPSGRPLKIEAGDKQIDSIFQFVEPTAVPLLEEIKVVSPPVRNVSETEFSAFRSGLADLLTEISAVTPTQGERGERGTRGYTGVQGAKGDKGEKGERGPAGGERGQQGEQGDKGDKGEKGDKGDKGEKGDKGDTGSSGADGVQGVQGKKGDKGDRGEKGLQGVQGKKGDTGLAGKKGDKGDKGDRGEQGLRGVTGARGETGVTGKRGADGANGKAGAKGAKGSKGDKGSTGDSGIISAKFPLVYDAAEKTISIDEARLDKILKKIFGGGKVSPQDMGWLASTGGGGKVAVYINGSKITPDVRTLDFTGAGVTATKVGGKVTVNFTGTGSGEGISGSYVASVNGMTDSINFKAGSGITYSVVGNTYTFQTNYTTTGVLTAGTAIDTDWLLLERTKDSVFPNNMRRIRVMDFVNSIYQAVSPTEVPSLFGNNFLLGGNLQIGASAAINEILDGAVRSVNGATGDVTLRGISFSYQLFSPTGATHGDRWMDSDNGQEYIYINDGNTEQWVQPAIPNVISSVVHTVVTISAATYEASNIDYYIGVSSGVPSTITLPEGPAYGREVIVKDEAGEAHKTSHSITVVGADSALIDNQASTVINTDYGSKHFIYNSGWRII